MRACPTLREVRIRRAARSPRRGARRWSSGMPCRYFSRGRSIASDLELDSKLSDLRIQAGEMIMELLAVVGGRRPGIVCDQNVRGVAPRVPGPSEVRDALRVFPGQEG